MAHTHFTDFLLGMKDPNIEISEEAQYEPYYRVQAFRFSHIHSSRCISHNFKHVMTLRGKLDNLPKACPHCGCLNQGSQDMIRHGHVHTAILIGQYNFCPVYLKLTKKRYWCKHCHKTCVARTKLVDAYAHISNSVKFVILEELSKIQSMSLIAKHLNFSTHTVLRQLETFGNNFYPLPYQLPQHLAIDEFRSVKSVDASMSCLLLDNATHRVVDVLEDRRQSSLRDYFLRFPLEERLKVQTITIDMNNAYISFLQRIFPHAEFIIDCFHIVQLLHRALNRIRVRIMNKVHYTRQRDYTKLKRCWKLLLKARDQLDFQSYNTHRLFDGLITEKGIVNYLLNIDEKLHLAYRLVQDMREAIDSHSHREFEDVLLEGKKYVLPKELRTAWTTLISYRDEIHNSLTYTLSNGPIEGTNNKIKNIKRSGFGYRNYGHFHCRILLCCDLFNQEKDPIRHIYYNEEYANKKYNHLQIA